MMTADMWCILPLVVFGIWLVLTMIGESIWERWDKRKAKKKRQITDTHPTYCEE